MSFFTYNTGIPNAPNNPSTDQPNMKTNTDSIDGWVDIDHFGFNDNQGGYHKDIHQPFRVGNPAAIASINQMYVKQVTPDFTGAVADTQLFTRTGLGGISQLTGNSAATDGWQWLGGVLIQWGRVTGLSGSWPTTDQTLTFKDRNGSQGIPFPTACYLVTTTFIGPSSSSAGEIVINQVNATNFHWQFTGSSGASFGGFYWIAIGA